MEKLSFLYHDFELILKQAPELLPGIEKLLAIYYEGQHGELQSKVLSNIPEHAEVKEFTIIDQKEYFGRMRIQNTPYTWLSTEDLPFEISTDKRTSDIFKEVNNIILLLKFRNPDDGLNDLLFIYFNHNLGNFGLSRSDKPLSTENKSIIASLLFNNFKSLISINKQNREVFRILKENNKAAINEAAYYKSELKKTMADYGESILNLCYSYLKDLSILNGRKYTLSEEAVTKLRSFKGNINKLKSIIRDSVLYIENMLSNEHFDEILINEWDINLQSYQEQTVTGKSAFSSEEKYLKTTQLLDKLENAARSVVRQNNNLTGANVGKACPEPITAPAITDALKKHKKKILYLFEHYPERWEVIRNRFRPVKNLIVSKGIEVEKSA